LIFKYTGIPSAETSEWLGDDPRIIGHLTQAYGECIPSIISPLTLDQRFLVNHHMVNLDFAENPMFVLGFHDLSHLILAILYVYPQYRGHGLGRYLISVVQERRNDVIQAAVDSRKPSVGKLLSQSGFDTLGQGSKDILGVSYIDYFWSPAPFRLERAPGGTRVVHL
jgi:GNAT superfamily N-acetyltransferase